LWRAQHDAYAAGIEERKVWTGTKQEFESEDISVETKCGIDIANCHRDLPNLG
jgi:hypothetical protein